MYCPPYVHVSRCIEGVHGHLECQACGRRAFRHQIGESLPKWQRYSRQPLDLSAFGRVHPGPFTNRCSVALCSMLVVDAFQNYQCFV